MDLRTGLVGLFLIVSFSFPSTSSSQSNLPIDPKREDGGRIESAQEAPGSKGGTNFSQKKCASPNAPSTEEVTIEALAPRPKGDLDEILYVEFLVRDDHKNGFDFDIPIVINARVEQFIECFQTTFREKFVVWLARSQRYIPFMKNVFRAHGLPEDLVYIVFIESGFDPYAYSKSRAVGPWQFIYGTGRKYGLRVDWWVDERRDIEKSTLAAAKYLKDLYNRFECWHLATAGYNAGEYKIMNAMKRYRTADFWKLAEYRYLKPETKNYVPQIIAAALIAKDPERYGFTEVEYQEPLRYEKVTVPALTSLQLVAKACEVSLDEIKELNPELQRNVTPPNEEAYELKIPVGKRETFLKNFEALQPFEKFQFRTHSVKAGETLSGIARRYGVDLTALLEINHLKRTSHISKGTTLLLPLAIDEETRPLSANRKKGLTTRTSIPKKGNLRM